jgi:hypothetical protein
VKDGKLYSIRPTDGSGDFTFSRGSNLAATRVDANGLIEKGRENLILQSNQFDTTWGNAGTTEIGGQADKDGGTSAWLLIRNVTNSYLVQTISQGNLQTFSIYAKAGSLSWFRILNTSSVGDKMQFFDLQNGALGVKSGLIDSSIESVGNGWYRCSITYNATTTGVRIYPAAGDNDTTGSSGDIYIQDAQLEQGLVATDYIETGASTAQAGILEDLPRLDYSGGASCPSLLLEPQRANLFTHSEYIDWWDAYSGLLKTANVATSPDGGSNAYKLYANSASSKKGIYKSFSVSASATSFSLFAKAGEIDIVQIGYGGTYGSTYANVNLTDGSVEVESNQTTSIENYGNGWYRITAVATPTAGTGYWFANITDDPAMIRNGNYVGNSSDGLYIFGTQLEYGSYPTSYIPTYGSAVTRSEEDEVQVGNFIGSGITTSGSWSLFFDISKEIAGAYDDDNSIIGILFGSSGALVSIRKYYGQQEGRIRFYSNLDVQTISYLDTSNKKWCMVVDDQEIKIYSDGALKYTSNLPSSHNGLDDLLLQYGSSERTSTSYSSVLVFPTALTSSEAIALTA